MKNYLPFGLIIILAILMASCKSTPKVDINDIDELGQLNFPTTGSDEAKTHFETGVLLLHSFEYEDSRAAFLRAQKADPNHAMSYWGEAMTYNHSLWKRQVKDKAINAMEKLDATPEKRMAKIATEFEQDLFQGIEILFGEGTKYDRDIAYSEYMDGLTEKYPDSHEVKAFYAISLIGASRNGRDEKLYNKTAKIAQGIMEENPNHPGALHYLIHSYDDPDHAHLAKSAADSYAKVAPDAAHALHMPSHIYVALGAWDDVVTSNIASWNASVKRMIKKDLDDGARSYHAYHWLQYGLLQRGETDAAAGILDKMVAYTDAKPDKTARGYLIRMKGAQMVENANWNGNHADIEVDVEDLSITMRAGSSFLEGMKAYSANNIEGLKDILTAMKKQRVAAALTVGEKGFAMCNAGGYQSRLPNQIDIDMVHVMELELEAYLSDLQGNKAEAEGWWRKGIALDESLNYSYGPPTILKPVHEAYAEWLLNEGKADDALAAFDKALDRNPRRLRSLQGKMKAAELLSNQEAIASVSKEVMISTTAKEWAEVL